MKSFFKHAFWVSTFLVFSGCAIAQGRFADTPTMELCMDYMNKPSMNFFHKSRAEELQRRGEDCSKFGNVVDARARADARFDSSMNKLQEDAKALRPKVNPATGPVICQSFMTGATMTTMCN